jgi:L-asparaginase II
MTRATGATAQPAIRGPAEGLYPENPVLARVWRGGHVESQHRGAWVVADTGGKLLAGAGDVRAAYFARSTLKSLQALPLLESGAAERFGLGDDELVLALASHSGEPCHTERVARLLARLGLTPAALQCGPQQPMDRAAREALIRAGAAPSALHNNCSGKHAGFLALALALGADPATYLDAASAPQVLVRRALASMAGVDEGALVPAVDGCSAPTYRLPLASLATALARVTSPAGLPEPRARACRRMTAAVAAHPELLAGSHKRLCTDLVRASGGRLFPKLGGEAVYVVAARETGRALAVKSDDGELRGLHAVVVALLERLGWLSADEAAALQPWKSPRLENWAGRTTGRLEVTL